jgi:hypothetical protein
MMTDDFFLETTEEYDRKEDLRKQHDHLFGDDTNSCEATHTRLAAAGDVNDDAQRDWLKSSTLWLDSNDGGWEVILPTTTVAPQDNAQFTDSRRYPIAALVNIAKSAPTEDAIVLPADWSHIIGNLEQGDKLAQQHFEDLVGVLIDKGYNKLLSELLKPYTVPQECALRALKQIAQHDRPDALVVLWQSPKHPCDYEISRVLVEEKSHQCLARLRSDRSIPLHPVFARALLQPNDSDAKMVVRRAKSHLKAQMAIACAISGDPTFINDTPLRYCTGDFQAVPTLRACPACGTEACAQAYTRSALDTAIANDDAAMVHRMAINREKSAAQAGKRKKRKSSSTRTVLEHANANNDKPGSDVHELVEFRIEKKRNGSSVGATRWESFVVHLNKKCKRDDKSSAAAPRPRLD